MKLVIWDVDGTLVDSRHTIQTSMERAFEACGLEPPPYEETRKIVGLSLAVGCERLAPEGTSEEDLAKLVEAYRGAFVHVRGHADFHEPMYDNARETLEALANLNCLQAIATGKSKRGLEALFASHDLRAFFDTIWCADDGPGKPHPFMVEQAMSALGAEAANTVMVGDAIHDIHMAKAAGVSAHGVSWGFGKRDELEAAGANELHDDMHTLSASLLRFAG